MRKDADGSPIRPFVFYEQEIGLLYIDRAYQGRGLGKGLFEIAKSEIGKTGVTEFFISCNKYNEKARRFYERMGGILVTEDEDLPDKSIPQVKYIYEI